MIADRPYSVLTTVRLSCGYHTFCGPHDALDFLENEWPVRHGATPRWWRTQ